MKFGTIDGFIIGMYLLGTMITGIAVRRSVGKVEHFLVAGREMNTYLGIASLAATEFGIVTCMCTAQNGYDMGFAGATPGILMALAMAFVGLTGFCIKPLRESGVMTLPELFDKQFGPKIRKTAGIVIVLGGLLNMGVFLRMGGEFLVIVAGLPANRLEMTMTAILVAVAIYTILGGMLSVLVTDYLQFIVMSIGLIVVTYMILFRIGRQPLLQAVSTHHGAGGFNPFVNPAMGYKYVLFNAFLNLAAVLTWQTTIARVLAAKSAETGRKIYKGTSFFFVCRFLIPGLWGIAALATLGQQFHGGDSIKAMPTFLATFVPTGILGLLIAAMLAADMSTDSSYMLTWSSVIYNDILAPFRKNWSEKRGLLVNRFIVAVIGVFLLFFGLWYKLETGLWDYLTITGTIYLSSISVLLVSCCYWKKASAGGATLALIIGALIPISHLICQKLEACKPFRAYYTTYDAGILAFVLAGLGMVVGTWLFPKQEVKLA